MALRSRLLLFAIAALVGVGPTVQAQAFEEAVHDVGNVGVTVTNTGFLGRSSVRNNPAGPPSFEYPLDSGVEHLFEAGLWVGAFRADGLVTVRTGAITSSGGYAAGAPGYEFTPLEGFRERSSLPESDAYSTEAVSEEDFLTAFSDTASFIPGTVTPTPSPEEQLGMVVRQRSYAFSFPFAEAFVIVEYEIENVSGAAWDSVYVGLFHDLVVRNVNTTTETGTNFFNKGGLGYLGQEFGPDGLPTTAPDSQFVSYAFNAGGTEESLNTYGAVAYLGGEWRETAASPGRFFHPFVADEYAADGLPRPRVNPRWWLFTSGTSELSRPQNDLERYARLSQPLPLDAPLPGSTRTLRERLAEDGLTAQGNFIGLTGAGPYPGVAPGGSITFTFAFVAALKPEAFQNTAGRRLDTDETRVNLRENVFWAQRTFAGEDVNYNGRLDAGEDLNGNGVLDRYLIPEPPRSPRLRVEVDRGSATLYWDASAEASVDPVSGRTDFEGYRVYRSDPGDDRSGNIFGQAGLVAQYDRPGNGTGFNNGFDAIRLDEPVTFPGDTTQYWYRYTENGLLNGWQYAFAVTAFDEGDESAGLEPLESSRTGAALRVFPGTRPADEAAGERPPVGVYPNPYRVQAAWDGENDRRIHFYNLPARCQIRVYTLAGEIVAELDHDAATYTGDIRWFESFSGPDRVVAGGEHAWDLLSESRQVLDSGLYLFSVRDEATGAVQTGKFVILR